MASYSYRRSRITNFIPPDITTGAEVPTYPTWQQIDASLGEGSGTTPPAPTKTKEGIDWTPVLIVAAFLLFLYFNK